jgi:hypothetical protein
MLLCDVIQRNTIFLFIFHTPYQVQKESTVIILLLNKVVGGGNIGGGNEMSRYHHHLIIYLKPGFNQILIF